MSQNTGGQNQSVRKNDALRSDLEKAGQEADKVAKDINRATNEAVEEGEKSAKEADKAANKFLKEGEKVAREADKATDELNKEGQRLGKETERVLNEAERVAEQIEEDVTGAKRKKDGQSGSGTGQGENQGGANNQTGQPGAASEQEQGDVQSGDGEQGSNTYEDRLRNYFRVPCVRKIEIPEIPEIEIPECPPEVVKALTLWQKIKRFFRHLFGMRVEDEEREPLPPPPPPAPLPPAGEPMDPYMFPSGAKPLCFPAMEYQPRFPEDRLDWYWSRCWNDLLVKVSCGLVLGLFARRLLSCRKAWWPFTVTTGAAVGMAYQNCENELSDLLTTCSKEAQKGNEENKGKKKEDSKS